MENPATWTEAERVAGEAYGKWCRAQEDGLAGLSVARMITDALRAAGLLRKEPEESVSVDAQALRRLIAYADEKRTGVDAEFAATEADWAASLREFTELVQALGPDAG